MFNKVFSYSAVSMAALALCACGGGGADTSTAPFQWASAAQFIPAGQDTLELAPSTCSNLSEDGSPQFTGATLTIRANGDVSYKVSGTERALIEFSKRTAGNFVTKGAPGAAGVEATASGSAPDHEETAVIIKPQSVLEKAIETNSETFEITQRNFRITRRSTNLDVQCELPNGALKANQTLTAERLKAILVPSTGKQALVSDTAVNGNAYLSYDPQTGIALLGTTQENATTMGVERADITEFTQGYSSTAARASNSFQSYSFTHWALVSLRDATVGGNLNGSFVFGQDSSAAEPLLRLSGGDRTVE